MGLIHSKSAVKYDRSDVSFYDSSSSSGYGELYERDGRANEASTAWVFQQ